MSRFLSLLALGGLCISSLAHAERCPGFADERLISLLDGVAGIAEQVDVATHRRISGLAQQVSTLRRMLSDSDPAALDAACRVMQQYPSIETGLQESRLFLQESAIQGWLNTVSRGGADGLRDLNCLDDRSYEGIRATLSILTITDVTLQSVCDGLSCYPLACRVCNVVAIIAGVLIPPIETGLAVDGLYCDTQHINDMESLCPVLGPGVCDSGRGTGDSLVEIESLVGGDLLTAVSTIDERGVKQETLDDTQALLEDRVQRTREQLDGLSSAIDADTARRGDFQADLRALAIEAALSGASTTAPIDLQLPASVGGRLEVVREIVADAIVSSSNAGLDVDAALPFLRAGDEFLNAGAYGDAFRNYRNAYRELVR